MKVRPAVINDIAAILALYRDLNREMAELQPFYIRPAEEDREFLEAAVGSETEDILIAEEDGEVMGMAYIQFEQTPVYKSIIPHRYTYLMDFIVRESLRGNGVGKKLLEGVENWGRSRGSEYMELDVLSQNLNALRVYEKENFEESVRVLRKRL